MKVEKADKLYGDLVDVIGQMSTSRRFKVGAVIVDDGLENIIAFGYNGTPRGWDNDCEIENEDGSLLLENDSSSGDSNYLLLETYALQTQSAYANNNDLDTAAGFDTSSTTDDILDFTERNPFGEVDF